MPREFQIETKKNLWRMGYGTKEGEAANRSPNGNLESSFDARDVPLVSS